MAIKGLIAILIFFLFLVPTSVFGILDIENKTLISDSEDSEIVLTLEFGENQYSKFDKPLPTLQSGLLVIGDSVIEIKDPRTKIMGNSFVIHSENILIYAKGMADGNFQINCYLIGGNQFDAIRLISISQENKSDQIKAKSIPTEMIVLVRQDIRTFWNDTYDFEIKVFDKKINPNPKFHQSFGAIEQADINLVLKDKQGKELTQFLGKTNSKGYWKGNYFVQQNLVPGGTYFIELNVNYLDSNNFQQFETFFVADTRSSNSSD